MKIYKLSVDIDGFGGHLEDRFFYNFIDAKKGLSECSGFFFDQIKKVWDIEGVKEIRVYEENDSFSISGIPYKEDEKDEWCIDYAHAEIIPIDIPGLPYDNNLHVLYKKYGYNSYLYSNLNGIPDSENLSNKKDLLRLSFSKSYIKKIARIHYKRLAREWNNKEYEEKCSPLTHGEDFITLLTYKIEGEMNSDSLKQAG